MKDIPGLPSIARVAARGNAFLRDHDDDCVVDESAPFLPNTLLGLWIVSTVEANGELQGQGDGGLAVSKDEVWYVSSNPSDPSRIGMYPTFDPDEDPDDLDLDPEDDLFSLIAGSFTDKQVRVPKGNGEMSGRWVDMPATLLSGLTGLVESDDKPRALSINLQPMVPEDQATFKKQYGRSVPPAWTDVQVDFSPNAELIAKGKDSVGRSVYIYTDAFRARQDVAKFARLGQVFDRAAAIESGLSRINNDHTTAATRLMLVEGIRVGASDEKRGKVMTYGATTLQAQHVSMLDNGNVHLSFVAKEGIPVEYEVDDPELVDFLRARLALDLPPDAKVFDTDDGQTKALLREVSGLPGMKNHDLRTLLANRIALLEIYSMIPPPPTDPDGIKSMRKKIAEIVSGQLRNKPSQALLSYINPAVFAPLFGGI